MMNILFFIPQLGCGGAEVLLKDISIELVKRGHKVKIIALTEHHHSFNNFPERELFIAMVPIEVFPVTFSNPFLFLKSKAVKQLQKIADDFKPDVIHSHLFLSEIVSRSIFYPGAKWFSHCHDNMRQLKPFELKDLYNKNRIKENVEKWYLFYRYYVNKGNRFIAISNNALEFFQQVLPTHLNNITLLFNCINVDRFKKPAHFQKKEEHQIQLSTIGSLVNKKNQAFLLHVLAELKQRNIDAHLNVLGDGVNRKGLEALAMRLKVENLVTFHGNQANVESYLWQSDLYVHSATYEPFGLVLIEAMAAGLPVVCLDGGGNRDIIEQNKNGIMVHQQDAEAFAQAILHIANNPTIHNEMSAYAAQYAARFDIKPYVDRLLELYRE